MLFAVPFAHNISFGDGTSALVGTGSPPTFDVQVGLNLPKIYNNPGDYTVTDILECGCNTLLTLATATRNVNVSCPVKNQYTFHKNNPSPGGTDASILKTGTLESGQLTINVSVNTDTSAEFKTWVEAAWDKTVTGCGVNLNIVVNLTRHIIAGSQTNVIYRKDILPPPGGSFPPPVNCGIRVANNPGVDEITVFSNGVCDDATTAKHEFGHLTGFGGAYILPHPLAAHGDQSDVMAWGDQVHDYHAKVLWERN